MQFHQLSRGAKRGLTLLLSLAVLLPLLALLPRYLDWQSRSTAKRTLQNYTADTSSTLVP